MTVVDKTLVSNFRQFHIKMKEFKYFTKNVHNERNNLVDIDNFFTLPCREFPNRHVVRPQRLINLEIPVLVRSLKSSNVVKLG